MHSLAGGVTSSEFRTAVASKPAGPPAPRRVAGGGCMSALMHGITANCRSLTHQIFGWSYPLNKSTGRATGTRQLRNYGA
eukprot:COSAG05_NODE_17311_length_327_cov_38.609649_1_plen_80_part_00